MYTVRVINLNNGESTDERDFDFGDFAEIGFWMDHYGYNNGNYKIEIRCMNPSGMAN
jgi:hypothetical protein